MIHHKDLAPSILHSLIRQKKIRFGGYRPGRIYGHLHCVSGKKMKPENRVFFADEAEARELGYRPCGKCMREEYYRFAKLRHK